MRSDDREHLGPVVTHAPETMADGWRSPSVDVSGGSRSAKLSPEGFSLWVTDGSVSAGATVAWTREHGDELVHVLDGRLAVGNDVCGTGETLVVESGFHLRIEALEESRVLHFGPTDPRAPESGHYGAASTEGRGAHIVGRGGIAALTAGPRDTRFIADSRCATCRPTLLFVSGEEEWQSTSHSHSEDEIVYVLSGTLRMGAYRADAGDAIAMPANLRYRLRSDGAFAFLNYRRDVSFQTVETNEPPLLETSAGNGFLPVFDVRRPVLSS